MTHVRALAAVALVLVGGPVLALGWWGTGLAINPAHYIAGSVLIGYYWGAASMAIVGIR